MSFLSIVESHHIFTTMDTKDNFKSVITNSPHFKFDDSQITEMRHQISDLIIRLRDLSYEKATTSNQQQISTTFARKKKSQVEVEKEIIDRQEMWDALKKAARDLDAEEKKIHTSALSLGQGPESCK